VVKRSLPTNHRQQATHAGRQILVFDIQLGVEGKLPAMTMGTKIVRLDELHLAHYGEDAPGAQLEIGCRVTAGASLFALLRARRIALQQLTKGHSAGLVHGATQGHFCGFQIQPAVFAAVLQDHLQQSAYFVGDFLLDRFGRFFPCGVRAWSKGRKAQILSLVAMSLSQSS
jgi:hypothetical protein